MRYCPGDDIVPLACQYPFSVTTSIHPLPDPDPLAFANRPVPPVNVNESSSKGPVAFCVIAKVECNSSPLAAVSTMCPVTVAPVPPGMITSQLSKVMSVDVFPRCDAEEARALLVRAFRDAFSGSPDLQVFER